MNALGRHILGEMYGCEAGILDNREKIERAMVNAALDAGAEVREAAFHKFSPQGVSGVVVISESHLAIHTWPELEYASVDVFTCGDKVDPWDAFYFLAEKLGAKEVEAQEIRRGFMPKIEEMAVNSGEFDKQTVRNEQTIVEKMSKARPINHSTGGISESMNIKPNRILLHAEELREKLQKYITIGA